MSTVDFLGIGVQKSGTTWLFTQMSRHPQVAFPRDKEFHYWDHASDPDAEAWVSSLEPATRVTPEGRRVVTGEITPAYALLHADRIRTIRARCPDIRLFIALRNPVERAWSHAVMDRVRAGGDPGNTSDAWFIDHFRSEGSRRRGDYAACLEQWWTVFPREQLLIIFTEDIAAGPASVLRSLASHMRIDESAFERIPETLLRETVRPLLLGAASLKPPPLRRSLVGPLIDMYTEGIDRLARLVSRDLEHWRLPP